MAVIVSPLVLLLCGLFAAFVYLWTLMDRRRAQLMKRPPGIHTSLSFKLIIYIFWSFRFTGKSYGGVIWLKTFTFFRSRS